MAARVVFIDRDGPVNVDCGFVSKKEDWQFAEKSPEALRKLQDAGFALGIITNQSGIARGLYTVADMQAVHKYMNDGLAKHGVTINAIAFCPHDRDSTCDCRKPAPGMAYQIEQKIGPVSYPESWTVGDKIADIKFGKAVGTKTALMRSKYWQESELMIQPDIIVDSLWEAAGKIVASSKKQVAGDN